MMPQSAQPLKQAFKSESLEASRKILQQNYEVIIIIAYTGVKNHSAELKWAYSRPVILKGTVFNHKWKRWRLDKGQQ